MPPVCVSDLTSVPPEDGGVITLELPDGERLREVVGELDQNLKVVARLLQVPVRRRGSTLLVGGEGTPPERAEVARRVLQDMDVLAGRGFSLSGSLVGHACRMVREDPRVRVASVFSDVLLVGRRNKAIFPRSVTQARYVEAIRQHAVVFGLGPAGTGKTYLAMAMAVKALTEGQVERIVLCRPAVEAGEKLGYLPGDLAEKVNPYLRPLYDALYDMVPFDRAARLLEKQVIEVAPLAFMRGRTLSDAFIILDEAQNTTSEQMKMFLTRLGIGSRAVVTGDPSQVDLPPRSVSGLVEAVEVLRDVEGIGYVRFSASDVVRHSLVADIIRAYDRAGSHRLRQGQRGRHPPLEE